MTASASARTAREIRNGLDHPVIDADGHFVEYMPALTSFLVEEGVTDLAASASGALYAGGTPGIERVAPEDRAGRCVRGPWWPFPAENARDIATAMMPDLLYERLDELGIDFAITYPSAGLTFSHIPDEATRRAACRAINRYSAEMFGPHANRMTPAAVIPLHTPQEGIDALEYAIGELGLKTAVIPSFVERPLSSPGSGTRSGGEAHNVWFDTYGLDSAHDYDPFWHRAVELGVSLSSHSATMGIGFRRSPTSYVANHIGNFGASGEALTRSLLLGGVTRRVPGLRVAMLEGGVHWAVGLLGDLLSHWEKRNVDAVQRYDPAKIDQAAILSLLEQHGQRLIARGRGKVEFNPRAHAGPFDDFEHVAARSAEDLADLFTDRFYFGCEADDPMASTAFDTSRTPLGRPIRAMFSSDIGHWDVPDMLEVLGEAWENVERGWLGLADFESFVFGNAVRFYTDTNPDFFAGTAVEAEAGAQTRTLGQPTSTTPIPP